MASPSTSSSLSAARRTSHRLDSLACMRACVNACVHIGGGVLERKGMYSLLLIGSWNTPTGVQPSAGSLLYLDAECAQQPLISPCCELGCIPSISLL